MRTASTEGSPLTPPHPTAYLPSMHHPLAEAPSAAPTDAASPTTPPPTPGAASPAGMDAGPVPPLPQAAMAAPAASPGDGASASASDAAFASDARDLGDAILRAAAERAEAEAITEADWTRAAAAGGVPYPRGGAWPASAIPEQVIIVDQRGRRYERMASGELRRIKGVAPEGEA